MLGQYFRRGTCKITFTKNVEWVFLHQFFLSNISHGVMSISWKIRVWSVKSSNLQDTILCFIEIIRRNYIRSYDVGNIRIDLNRGINSMCISLVMRYKIMIKYWVRSYLISCDWSPGQIISVSCRFKIPPLSQIGHILDHISKNKTYSVNWQSTKTM